MTDEQTDEVHPLDQITVLNPHWPDEGIPAFGPPPEPDRLDGDWTVQWCDEHQQAINDWINDVLPEVLDLLPAPLRRSEFMWVEPHFRYDDGKESGILGFDPAPSVMRLGIEAFAVDGWNTPIPNDPAAPDAKEVASAPVLYHPSSSEPIEFNLNFQLTWAWTTPLPITCDNPGCGCRDWLNGRKEHSAVRVRELDDQVVRINPTG